MMPTPALLSYAVTPGSVPAGQIVTLEIIVSNQLAEFVTCSEIVFTLPADSGAPPVAGNPGAITVAPAAGTSWSISGDGSGSFRASPGETMDGLAAAGSIAFVFSGVKVSALSGLAQITVLENSGAPQMAREAPPLEILKTPPGLPGITQFVAAPVTVAPGEEVLLSWTSISAESCQVSWSGGLVPVMPNSGMAVTPTASSTYTLTVTNDQGQSVSETINITVVSQDADTGTNDGLSAGIGAVLGAPSVPNKRVASPAKKFADRIRAALAAALELLTGRARHK